jgi:hypothetical protein
MPETPNYRKLGKTTFKAAPSGSTTASTASG